MNNYIGAMKAVNKSPTISRRGTPEHRLASWKVFEVPWPGSRGPLEAHVMEDRGANLRRLYLIFRRFLR
jgi:hypothetical protein